VHRYLQQNVALTQAGTWTDVRKANRMGTGEVQFEGICFCGSDNAEGAPRSGGRLTVDLVVNAHRPVRVSSLAVKVSIPRGPLLIEADPLMNSDLPVELDVGQHRMRVEIESLGLTPGSYTIGVSMGRGGSGRAWSVFDAVDDVVRLEVDGGFHSRTRRGDRPVVPSRSTLTHLSEPARRAQ
jgi:hypothetical protein